MVDKSIQLSLSHILLIWQHYFGNPHQLLLYPYNCERRSHLTASEKGHFVSSRMRVTDKMWTCNCQSTLMKHWRVPARQFPSMSNELRQMCSNTSSWWDTFHHSEVTESWCIVISWHKETEIQRDLQSVQDCQLLLNDYCESPVSSLHWNKSCCSNLADEKRMHQCNLIARTHTSFFN